jgi:hypothetical protein
MLDGLDKVLVFLNLIQLASGAAQACMIQPWYLTHGTVLIHHKQLNLITTNASGLFPAD